MVAVLVMLALSVLAVGGLNRFSEKSLNMKCQSNLRQLAIAGQLYIADKDGQLPDRGTWALPASNGKDSLLPYLGLSDRVSAGYAAIMLCPAVAKSAFRPNATDQRSYAINQFAAGSDNSSDNARTTFQSHVVAKEAPLKIGRVANPSAQAFFMDGPMVVDNGGFRFSTFQSCDRLEPTVTGSQFWRTYFPHSQCVNVVFLDGHLGHITEEVAMEKLVGTSTGSPSPRTEPFWGAAK